MTVAGTKEWRFHGLPILETAPVVLIAPPLRLS